jgi:leucyl-tRNA synthetase
VRAFLLLLAPYAPHLTEELWHRRGYEGSVHQQAWPTWDPALAAEETIEVVVQLNGKVRDKLTVPADSDGKALEQAALTSSRVQELIGGKPVRRVIVVPGKLVNILV